MNNLSIERTPSGELAILGIDTLLAACLYRIPEILQRRGQPGVRERLFPDLVPEDPAFNQEWHEQLDGELQYLFASAEETMVRDMAALEGQRLVIPAEHREAWLSALNQARLILGEMHQLQAADMEREDLTPDSERDLALLQIHVYGYLLNLLVEAA